MRSTNRVRLRLGRSVLVLAVLGTGLWASSGGSSEIRWILTESEPTCGERVHLRLSDARTPERVDFALDTRLDSRVAHDWTIRMPEGAYILQGELVCRTGTREILGPRSLSVDADARIALALAGRCACPPEE